MNRGGEHNLSATRGNALGIAFFRLLLGCCGLRVACWFVAPVTWFYTLFDRRARQAARPCEFIAFRAAYQSSQPPSGGVMLSSFTVPFAPPSPPAAPYALGSKPALRISSSAACGFSR